MTPDDRFSGPAPDNRLRIGVRVVGRPYNRRIYEAMTKAFEVQDRGTNTRFRPGLRDEVWRLKHISWGGVLHERLTRNNVRNVQDFLRMLTVKPDELRSVCSLIILCRGTAFELATS